MFPEWKLLHILEVHHPTRFMDVDKSTPLQGRDSLLPAWFEKLEISKVLRQSSYDDEKD